MVLTNVNSKGRIYVDKYEFKNLAYMLIESRFSNFKFIELTLTNKEINLTLKNYNEYKLTDINMLRNCLIEQYKNKLNFEVTVLNIEVL